MQARVIIGGRYEVAVTSRGDRVLSLNGVRAFQWTDDADGEWLSRTPAADAAAAGSGARVACVGEFFLVAYLRGPYVGHELHLFLADGASFEEFVLPRGVPSGAPDRRRMIATGERLSRAEVLQYVANPPSTSFGVVRTSETPRPPPAPPTPPAPST